MHWWPESRGGCARAVRRGTAEWAAMMRRLANRSAGNTGQSRLFGRERDPQRGNRERAQDHCQKTTPARSRSCLPEPTTPWGPVILKADQPTRRLVRLPARRPAVQPDAGRTCRSALPFESALVRVNKPERAIRARDCAADRYSGSPWANRRIAVLRAMRGLAGKACFPSVLVYARSAHGLE